MDSDCFISKKLGRVRPLPKLELDFLVVGKPPAGLTPDRCLGLCARDNFTFAGLEFGVQCWCGHRLPDFGTVPPEQCNIPCRGDHNFTNCGADGLQRVIPVPTGPERAQLIARAVAENIALQAAARNWKPTDPDTEVSKVQVPPELQVNTTDDNSTDTNSTDGSAPQPPLPQPQPQPASGSLPPLNVTSFRARIHSPPSPMSKEAARIGSRLGERMARMVAQARSNQRAKTAARPRQAARLRRFERLFANDRGTH